MHYRGSQEVLLNIIKYIVGVLGPIPSGYDPDDESEERVQVPVRDWNIQANALLQSTHYYSHEEGKRGEYERGKFSDCLLSSGRRRQRGRRKEGCGRRRGRRQDVGAIILVGEAHGADGTVKIESRRGHIRGLRISSGMSCAKL